MKKLFTVATITVALLFSNNNEASAQNKFGYFDLENVVSLMPGVSKVDTLMAVFEQDSLGLEYRFRVSEYQRNDSTLKADSAKIPAKFYQEKRDKLLQDVYLLQNWQQYSQQVVQQKQQQLMAPFYQKAVAAFQKVIDEGKYTYVFKRESLWQAPPADDISALVAKKLGLKYPTTEPQQAPPTEKAPTQKPQPKGKTN